MTPLTNYNSGPHLFYGWAPKLSTFLFCRTEFFLLLDLTLTCSLAISCYLQTCFSHSVTDSLHKPFSCVISIILRNGYSPQLPLSAPFNGVDTFLRVRQAESLNHSGCSSRFKSCPGMGVDSIRVRVGVRGL